MKKKIIFIGVFIFIYFNNFSQKVLKENLTKKETFYFDFLKTKPQSIGSYYKDDLGETKFKHGTWLYYNENEVEIEKRDYYKDVLHGKVLLFYANKKPRQEGYFKLGIQDSIYKEWYENGNLALESFYKNGKLNGFKKTYYFDGHLEKVEEYIDSTVYLWEYYLPDSTHTQSITKGNGELIEYFNIGNIKKFSTYEDGIPNGEYIERSIYSYDLINGNYLKGKRSGEWKFYYYTGDIEKIVNYKNDNLDGEYKYFYDNNQINVQGFYKNGLKFGEWTWYTKQGNRDMQGSFVDGLQDGKWTYWYPTGELSYIAFYKKDLKDGTWTYYYKNGSKFKIGNYANDLKHGNWETFYENGVLLMKGEYYQGKEEGDWYNFWDNSQLKNKSTFKKGVLNGGWFSHFPNGDLKLIGKYKNGNKNGTWQEFYKGNKPKEIITYKVIKKKSKIKYGPLKDINIEESTKNGKYILYSEIDSKVVEEGSYSNDEKNGEWKAYFPGSKFPANIINYKNGKLDGTMKEFDKRGLIISEVEYKDGLKHGKLKIYDKKGKVISEKKYSYGIQVNEGNVNFTPGR